jgi:three-Cys-motif partner protein
MGLALENLKVDDDGLLCGPVHHWAEDKYRLLDLYCRLFSSGMKNKWDERVYIDLYAGGGFSHIQGTRTFLKGSPIIALTVPCPFDKYIFCEEDEARLTALRTRVGRIAPSANVSYVLGSCDVKVDEIRKAIPMWSPRNRVLSLCVVDPFDFSIKFTTLKKLADVYVDFVVLLATGMDANRNQDHYVEGGSPKIDEALGNTEWRERWKTPRTVGKSFSQFLAAEFSRSMESLGFVPTPLNRMKLVKMDEKNVPLYYLALFSKNKVAHKFWDQVLKYGTDQRSLFE